MSKIESPEVIVGRLIMLSLNKELPVEVNAMGNENIVKLAAHISDWINAALGSTDFDIQVLKEQARLKDVTIDSFSKLISDRDSRIASYQRLRSDQDAEIQKLRKQLAEFVPPVTVVKEPIGQYSGDAS